MNIQTKPIEIPEDLSKLEGMRVLYQHFNCFGTLYTGTIEQAKLTAAGIEVYICPDRKEESDKALLAKWKNLAIDSVVEMVETPPFNHPALKRVYQAGNTGNLATLYQVNRPDYLKD